MTKTKGLSKFPVHTKFSLKLGSLSAAIVLKSPITSNTGERIFSLLKRILRYTRCTVTEGRLNDLAHMALLTPFKAVHYLSTEKIINKLVNVSFQRNFVLS